MIFTIRAFVTFFTIIDPVGLAPVVIGLTAHLNKKAQRSTLAVQFILNGIAICPYNVCAYRQLQQNRL